MKSAGREAVRAAETAAADAGAVEKIRLMYKPVNSYRLRHSYAVRLLLASGNKELVQKALGHANIETTDFYTQMVTDPRRRRREKGLRHIGSATLIAMSLVLGFP